jgi:hypothetical protein
MSSGEGTDAAVASDVWVVSPDYLEQLRPFLMQQRQALLMQVDSIERMLGLEPTTADLRKGAKRGIMPGKD